LSTRARRSAALDRAREKPWDYTLFGDPRGVATFEEASAGVRQGQQRNRRLQSLTINGKSYDDKAEPRVLRKGRRYRLVFENQTDDAHPVHLHRNSFELTNVNAKVTAAF